MLGKRPAGDQKIIPKLILVILTPPTYTFMAVSYNTCLKSNL